MATTYTRRVNLYINVDGKQVKNDIKSIKAEMQHLINAQAKMIVGSTEYNRKTKQIQQLDGILKKHQAEIRNTSQSWGTLKGAAANFNKYVGVITGAVAAFAGTAMVVKGAVEAYAALEDKMADVMKTTGLTKDQVVSLNNELKKIDTRTSQTDLLNLATVAGKLGISAEKDVLGFVRAADKIKVALGEDLGGDAEAALNSLGKLTDIFKLKQEFGIEESMLKVGSAINSLGAAGTAAEANLVDFATRVGGVAPAAGISIEKILGLGATLDELGISAEVAGSSYTNIISSMFVDTQTYADVAGMSLQDFTDLMNTDANEAFIKVLEGSKGAGKGFGEIATNLAALGLDGARATSMMGVLAGNIDLLRQRQSFSNAEFEKGTSILNEYNIKNNTVAANLDKSKKGFADLQVTLGEKLAPAYTQVINATGSFLTILVSVVSFLFKYSGVIVTLTAAVIAYNVAAQLQYLWETRKNAAAGLGLVITKAQTVWTNALKGATLLYAAAQALLSGNIGRASAAMKVFNAVTKMNPIGLVIAAVVALGTALYKYINRTEQVTAAQKARIDVEIQAQQSIVEQKKKVEDLIKVAGDERISLEERKKALAELNDISPEYFKNLSIEKWNTDEAKKASDLYTESLIRNARAVAAQQMMIDLEKQRISDSLSGKDKELSFWQKLKAKDKGWLAKGTEEQRKLALETENATKAQEEYNQKMEALGKIIDENKDNPPPPPAATEEEKDGGKNKTKVETPEEKAAREKKEKDAADASKKSAKDAEQRRKESQDKALKALDEAYAQRQLTIEQNQIKEQESEEAFKARMALAEMAFLEQKRAMLEAFGLSTVEIERAIAQKRLDNQMAINSVLTAEQIKQKDALKQVELQGTDETLARAQQAADEQVRIQQEEIAKKEEQIQAYLGMAEQMGDGIAQLFMDQNATLADFLRESLVMVLDYVEKVMLAKIAESTIGGIAQGPIGIVKAIAKIIAIKAAFGIAKAAIVGKKKGRGGYAEGGYTASGNPSEPAGIVHKGEWVASADMVRNPATAGIISALENYRQTRVQPNPALYSGKVPFASGGYVTSVPGAQNETAQQNNEMYAKLIATIENFMLWKPKVYTEEIKKQLDTLDSINKNRNL